MFGSHGREMYKVCIDVWESWERDVLGVFRCLGETEESCISVCFDVWETQDRDI